jgi:hypothetical protein
MHHHDEDAWWNRIPYELKCKGEIGCYNKINVLYLKYPLIIYNHSIRYKQRLKNIARNLDREFSNRISLRNDIESE